MSASDMAAVRLSAAHLTMVVLCGLVLFLDGFDTQAISYAAPLIGREWHLSRAMLGPIFSSALGGLMLGYLGLSPLSDRFGHRRVMIASTAAFGLLTLLTVFIHGAAALIALRFLTGIPLGSAAPSAIALTTEQSPPRLRATFILAIYCGFSLGFVAAGAFAARLLAAGGWRALFYAGAIMPLLLSPLLLAALPRASAEEKPADTASPGSIGGLLREGRLVGTLLLWVVFVLNLGAFYLLQSWLPALLLGEHRPLGLVTSATMMSAVGGIAAAFVVGPAMDRFGASRSLATLYAVGALGVAWLGPALATPTWELLATSFAAGFCISGGQKSAIALAGLFYPAPMRSTGVGWSLGIGRAGGILGPLLGGVLLGAGWSATALFVAVALAMLLTALATLLIDRVRP